MVTRKYIGDYRLDESLDARGRIRTRAVYTGGDYAFITPERTSLKRRRALLGHCAASWALCILALVPRSLAAHTIYCALPMAATVIPLVYQSHGALVAWRVKEPFRHDQADKLTGRLPVSALLTLIFSGIALIGLAAAAFLTPEALTAGDAVFAVCGALMNAASAINLHIARGFQTKKCETVFIKRENV